MTFFSFYVHDAEIISQLSSAKTLSQMKELLARYGYLNKNSQLLYRDLTKDGLRVVVVNE